MPRNLFAILVMLLVSCRLLATNFVIDSMCFEVINNNDRKVSLALCWDNNIIVDIPEIVEWQDQSYKVVEIAPFALRNCLAMKQLKVPKTCVKIHTTSLYYPPLLERIILDQDNTAYSDIDGVLFNKEQTILYSYPRGRMNETYNVPDGVTTIADNAFFKCTWLHILKFPTSLTQIGQSAFAGCHALESLTLPEHLVEVDHYAFYDCAHLHSVKVMGNDAILLGEQLFSYTTYINGELQLNSKACPQTVFQFRKLGFSRISFFDNP